MIISERVKQYVVLGNTPFWTLIVKYSLIVVYGVLSVIFGNISISIVNGDMYAFWWSLCIAVFSALALLSVALWYNGKPRYELTSTLLLAFTLFGYSIDIFVRCGVTHSTAALAAGMLPLIICVYPFARIINILRSFDKL